MNVFSNKRFCLLPCTLGAEPQLCLPVQKMKDHVDTPKRAPPKERQPLKTQSSKKMKRSTEVLKETTTTALRTEVAVQTDIDMSNFLEVSKGLHVESGTNILAQQIKETNVKFVSKDYVVTLQNKISELEQKLQIESKQLKNQVFSLEDIKDDKAAILFYTGFPNYKSLFSFYTYLEPKLKDMQYWRGEKITKDVQAYQVDPLKDKSGPKRKLSHLDEMFIVLLRLKAGLFVQDLASRFGISPGLVSRICITWINLLYFELKELFPFPSQDLIRKNMPKEFSEAYPTTRIILDCTELFIQRPSAMLAQSETWSDYKHQNTWKALVGISPNGQVTFLSELWGGRVSDKKITKECGVLQLLEAGDNVMVDRGFQIQDIVPPNVTVNIPPFLASRNQMTAEETTETMSIASLRIHVERAIGRIKNYHILDGTLPNTLSPYATQIFTVCGYLTNFLPPLLKPGDV